MRLLTTMFPSWFPARWFAMLSGGAALLLLLAVLPLWLLNSSAEKENAELRDLFTMQTTLKPFVDDLRTQKADVQELIVTSKPLPDPASLSETIVALQTLSESAGLREAHFIPVAESVVERKLIRLDGKISADVEAFRRFIILLGDQPWVAGLDSCTLAARDTVPEFTLTMWVNFKDAGTATGSVS